MGFKKLGALFLSVLLLSVLTISTFAVDQGGYSVSCDINYYNPDTGEIDDGGSANAALGEGMCRSATATSALVERDGDSYYVTIRLLLQSNTKDVIFWRHTGYNVYEEVSYEIMMEDAGTDSVDYRFQVDDPFAPIKASMYVTPMGRSTVWYIELDESSLSANTGDFVVSVSTTATETPVVEETFQVEETPALEETLIEEEPTEVEEAVAEAVELDATESSVPEETSEEVGTPEIEETTEVEEVVETSEAIEATTEEVSSSSNTGLYVGVAVAVIVVAGIAVVVVKKGKK